MMMIPNRLIPPNLQSMPLGQIFKIFRRMFGLLREQSVLWTPIMRMVLLNMILFCLLIISTFNLTHQKTSLGLILLGITCIGYIIRGSYFGYLFGIIAAMVYLYLHGNHVSLKNAKQLTMHHRLSLGTLYLLSHLFTALVKKKRKEEISPTLLARLMFSSVSIEALDLFGHFLVPVIIIENLTLTQSLGRLQGLRNHLPATFAGLIGVDITKNIVSILLIPFIIGIMILSGYIGQHFVNLFPDNTVLVIGTFIFSWLPLLFGTFFLIFMVSFIKPCMDCLKIIYFTLLYALISHPEKIQPAIRERFTGLVPHHEQPHQSQPQK